MGTPQATSKSLAHPPSTGNVRHSSSRTSSGSRHSSSHSYSYSSNRPTSSSSSSSAAAAPIIPTNVAALSSPNFAFRDNRGSSNRRSTYNYSSNQRPSTAPALSSTPSLVPSGSSSNKGSSPTPTSSSSRPPSYYGAPSSSTSASRNHTRTYSKSAGSLPSQTGSTQFTGTSNHHAPSTLSADSLNSTYRPTSHQVVSAIAPHVFDEHRPRRGQRKRNSSSASSTSVSNSASTSSVSSGTRRSGAGGSGNGGSRSSSPYGGSKPTSWYYHGARTGNGYSSPGYYIGGTNTMTMLDAAGSSGTASATTTSTTPTTMTTTTAAKPKPKAATLSRATGLSAASAVAAGEMKEVHAFNSLPPGIARHASYHYGGPVVGQYGNQASVSKSSPLRLAVMSFNESEDGHDTPAASTPIAAIRSSSSVQLRPTDTDTKGQIFGASSNDSISPGDEPDSKKGTELISSSPSIVPLPTNSPPSKQQKRKAKWTTGFISLKFFWKRSKSASKRRSITTGW